jgi:diketogulonate reductase-like aldo/keto reductase
VCPRRRLKRKSGRFWRYQFRTESARWLALTLRENRCNVGYIRHYLCECRRARPIWNIFTAEVRRVYIRVAEHDWLAERQVAKTRGARLLNRREFNALCRALGSFVAPLGAFAVDAATAVASNGTAQTVKFRDGTIVPAIGQGSAGVGQGKHPAAEEEEALRTGLSLGMTLIDTAENYGGGRSEELIGRVTATQRDRAFLVSKVETDHVTGDSMARACAASLSRLGTDYLDLYLLHWPVPNAEFSGVVAGFESLRAAGKIRGWGVSNFTVRQMEDLFRVPQGDRCATNQVPYSVGDRGIEWDLLPWCTQHGMPVMAYSPLGGPGASLLRDPTLAHIAAARGCSAAAVALAWTIRSGNVIAIPESGSPAHVKENAVALALTLTPQELQTLDAAHPPTRAPYKGPWGRGWNTPNGCPPGYTVQGGNCAPYRFGR